MSLRAPEAERLLNGPLAPLRGAVLQSARQPHWDRVTLALRAAGLTLNLMLVARPGFACFHTVQKAPINPPRPLAFQGLLRARLRGRVESISLRGGDRLLDIRFSDLSLLLLFAGHKSDLLLVDREDRVLGSLRSTTATGETFVWTGQAGTGITDRFKTTPDEALDQAVATFFSKAEAERAADQQARRIATYRARLLKRINKQRSEAQRGKSADEIRHQADLVRSSFHLIKRGADSVVVHDWTSGDSVALSLDPALGPAENLDRLYRRAAKAARAGTLAAERLEASLAELKRLDQGTLPEALQQNHATQGPPRLGRKKGSVRLPYSTWNTPAGKEFRVGRGAAENDALTFRHARGNDVWLHVRGRPGAHVVLRNPGPSPSPDLLILGAQLAMKHSGLKPGTREEVSWTRVKELRKPKGLGPGKVLLRSEKVLYVTYDPEAIVPLTRA